MTDDAADFSYSNLSGRPAGPFVSLAARVLPGVRAVQAEIAPYAAAWQQANRAALAQRGPLWVALGDSMTQGVGASAFDRGWVSQLQQRLAREGDPVRVLNLSSSGARVRDVLDRQLPVLEGLSARPVLVTVLIGSNDLFRRGSRQALPTVFAELLARLPTGSVIANLPNPNAAAQAINVEIHRAVAERGLVLADLRTGDRTSWRGKLAADHFHPNDLGYAEIARLFGDTIAARWPVQRTESKMSSQAPAGRPTSTNHSALNARR